MPRRGARQRGGGGPAVRRRAAALAVPERDRRPGRGRPARRVWRRPGPASPGTSPSASGRWGPRCPPRGCGPCCTEVDATARSRAEPVVTDARGTPTLRWESRGAGGTDATIASVDAEGGRWRPRRVRDRRGRDAADGAAPCPRSAPRARPTCARCTGRERGQLRELPATGRPRACPMPANVVCICIADHVEIDGPESEACQCTVDQLPRSSRDGGRHRAGQRLFCRRHRDVGCSADRSGSPGRARGTAQRRRRPLPHEVGALPDDDRWQCLGRRPRSAVRRRLHHRRLGRHVDAHRPRTIRRLLSSSTATAATTGAPVAGQRRATIGNNGMLRSPAARGTSVDRRGLRRRRPARAVEVDCCGTLALPDGGWSARWLPAALATGPCGVRPPRSAGQRPQNPAIDPMSVDAATIPGANAADRRCQLQELGPAAGTDVDSTGDRQRGARPRRPAGRRPGPPGDDHLALLAGRRDGHAAGRGPGRAHQRRRR